MDLLQRVKKNAVKADLLEVLENAFYEQPEEAQKTSSCEEVACL